jgi:hypothetical protein
LKSHFFPTTTLAWTLDQMIDGISVYSGMTLDHYVGGLNPYAVEPAMKLGTKIVWLPTLASHQDAVSGIAARLGLPQQGIRVTDDEGNVLPVVRDIFELVEANDGLLATGHVSAEEHYAIAKAFGFSGRIIVTHAMDELAGPHLTKQHCVELADLGATIEFCALTCIPFDICTGRPIEAIAEAMKAVGPERVVLGSDLGFSPEVPHPADGYEEFVEWLFQAGASSKELETMGAANPARLLELR